MSGSPAPDGVLAGLGLRVIERGWLSSNNIVFDDGGGHWTVVDTGYVAHAPQTVELLGRMVGDGRVARVFNTHLHSDHCGGNLALQQRWDAAVAVPRACHAAARDWDASQLSFDATGQRCDRFRVDGAIEVGERLRLGGWDWQVLAAPGHDPTAVMFFEPVHRVLIAGDALWRDRLAVVFPEIEGGEGFGQVDEVLAAIEQLRPAVVIPGHGAPFGDVTVALQASRSRLAAFRRDPQRHRAYAARALLMFRMLEWRATTRAELVQWLVAATTLRGILSAWSGPQQTLEALALALIERMVNDGLLQSEGEHIRLPA